VSTYEVLVVYGLGIAGLVALIALVCNVLTLLLLPGRLCGWVADRRRGYSLCVCGQAGPRTLVSPRAMRRRYAWCGQQRCVSRLVPDTVFFGWYEINGSSF
jgi:hypothetical protein